LKDASITKEGRVLSEANRSLIADCIASLQKLMDATEKEEPKEVEPQGVFSKEALQLLSKTMKKTDKEIGLTLRSIKHALNQKGGEK
jgi:hypothetical protein